MARRERAEGEQCSSCGSDVDVYITLHKAATPEVYTSTDCARCLQERRNSSDKERPHQSYREKMKKYFLDNPDRR